MGPSGCSPPAAAIIAANPAAADSTRSPGVSAAAGKPDPDTRGGPTLAAAGTALAGGPRRSRRPDTADVAPVILAALILATALSVLLGVITAGRAAR